MMIDSATNSYVLTMSCPDGKGIVAAITGFIAEHGGLITEAARVDGANAWQVFWRIKLPLLAPVIGIVSRQDIVKMLL